MKKTASFQQLLLVVCHLVCFLCRYSCPEVEDATDADIVQYGAADRPDGKELVCQIMSGHEEPFTVPDVEQYDTEPRMAHLGYLSQDVVGGPRCLHTGRREVLLMKLASVSRRQGKSDDEDS